MPRKSKPKPDSPEQFKRFIEMAREVAVDEHPDALDRAFRKIARSKVRDPKNRASVAEK